MDKTPYTGWLTSPDIGKRSLAVFGHFFLGYFIIIIGFVGVALVFSALAAIISVIF